MKFQQMKLFICNSFSLYLKHNSKNLQVNVEKENSCKKLKTREICFNAHEICLAIFAFLLM